MMHCCYCPRHGYCPCCGRYLRHDPYWYPPYWWPMGYTPYPVVHPGTTPAYQPGFSTSVQDLGRYAASRL